MGSVRTELLRLIGFALAVHAVFIGAYYMAGIGAASGDVKLGFTVAWTVAALAAVLIGLTRVRRARVAALRGGRRP